jgi:hypothetical protein
LKERSKRFGLDTIRYSRELSPGDESRIISGQPIRSA